VYVFVGKQSRLSEVYREEGADGVEVLGEVKELTAQWNVHKDKQFNAWTEGKPKMRRQSK
jgi:hypothetical protein